MNTRPKVGFIGLGAMGRGAAGNLLAKGFDVVGCDVRAEALDWLRAQGGTPVSSLAEMASRVQIVVCFVVNSQQAEAVLFGDGGLVGELAAGTVFIACSTMDPGYVRGARRSARAARDLAGGRARHGRRGRCPARDIDNHGFRDSRGL